MQEIVFVNNILIDPLTLGDQKASLKLGTIDQMDWLVISVFILDSGH